MLNYPTRVMTDKKSTQIRNEKDVQAIKWNQADRLIRIDSGLYLNVRKSSKTYIIRKKYSGKMHVVTLGKSPALSLREAKAKAAEYALSRDVNSVTVEALINDYKKDVVDPHSKVPRQVYGYLNHIEECLGRKKVSDIERFELVRFIKEYSAERGARSADRLRSYLKQLFNYGVELGYLKGASPLDGVTKRVTGYIAVERKRVLTHDEIRAIWKWKNPDIHWQITEDNARFLKFLLFTGLRIREAQTGYVDGDKFRLDDTKGKHPRHMKRPHWVYLTKSAKACLPLPKCSHTNIQAWLKRTLLKEGYSDDERYTPHDLRRTFATIAREHKVRSEAIEKVLNHKLLGVASVYDSSELEEDRIECAKVVENAILKILTT